MRKLFIDFGSTEEAAPLREFEISGSTYSLRNVISVDNSGKYLRKIGKGMSPKHAFYEFAFIMYCETNRIIKPSAKTRRSFKNMSDDEAINIMRFIVEISCDDQDQLCGIETHDSFEEFKKFIVGYVIRETEKLAETLNNLASSIAKQITENFALSIQEIQTLSAEIMRTTTEAMHQSFVELNEVITQYFKKRAELDPIMAEFGWGGLSAIPGNIIQFINANKSRLSSNDVDELITDYYESENFREFELLVSSWWWNPSFSSRKLAILEAFSCYKLRLNIASITLITIHMEGIIKEFLFWSFGIVRKRDSSAIQEVRERSKNQNNARIPYMYECNIKALEEIERRYSENFKIEQLDETSNLSRHKIAHGHMCDEVSKADVLKTFLWVNELENLLSSMLKQTEINKNEV